MVFRNGVFLTRAFSLLLISSISAIAEESLLDRVSKMVFVVRLLGVTRCVFCFLIAIYSTTQFKALGGKAIRRDLQPLRQRVQNNIFYKSAAIAAQAAINGEEFECDTSASQHFFSDEFQKLTPTELMLFDELFKNEVDLWPLFNIFFNGQRTVASSRANEFAPDKQQGTEYKKRLKDLENFWDVHTENVTLYSLNGNFYFSDDEFLVPYVADFYGNYTQWAKSFVDLVQETMTLFPAIGPSFFFYSYVAAAFPEISEPIFQVDNSIIMGDGIYFFLESVGLQDAGPDYIFTHEFGHHVQFGLNLTEINLVQQTPESTRYLELMADAYAAYFTHHPRGASFQTKRIMEVSQAAFGGGDCDFDFPGHHGTPKQRAKAVQFAVDLIDKVKGGKGKILKAAEFKAKFDAAYAGITAPDTV